MIEGSGGEESNGVEEKDCGTVVGAGMSEEEDSDDDDDDDEGGGGRGREGEKVER